MCSVLWKVLRPLGDENAHLIVWSDNCVSQNQCWRILEFHAWLVKTKRFKSVRLRMLEKGHTFTLCDLYFGAIEQQCFKKQLETQEDYMHIMEDAHCVARELKQEDMYKWDFVQNTFQKTRYLFYV